jgi:hypothetical protein
LVFELPVTQKIIEKKFPKILFKAESAPGSMEFVELFSLPGKIHGKSSIVIKKCRSMVLSHYPALPTEALA